MAATIKPSNTTIWNNITKKDNNMLLSSGSPIFVQYLAALERDFIPSRLRLEKNLGLPITGINSSSPAITKILEKTISSSRKK
jgi:hypothetical protein